MLRTDILSHASQLILQKSEMVIRVNKILFAKPYIAAICLAFMLALVMQLPIGRAQTTEVVITPDFIETVPGSNITISVVVSNAVDLYYWQGAIKYNGSILECTAVWVPTDNVFAGRITIPVEPVFDTDSKDNKSYVFYALSILVGSGVDVTSGVLFKMNFTAIGSGASPVLVATEDKPVQEGSTTWFSYLGNSESFNDEIEFTATDGTVVSSFVDINVKPVADFKATSLTVDNSTYFVLDGHGPAGTVPFAQSYKGYALSFNASKSYDADGNITSYVWDFDDGNITQTSDPFITHVYATTGTYNVKLFVVDDGNPDPPLESDSVTFIVVVGLVLDRFDWMPFIYIVLALIVIAIVVFSVRAVIRKLGERKRAIAARTMIR